VPVAVESIDASLLDPRSGWPDPEAYDTQAQKLVALFNANVERLGGPLDMLDSAGPILKMAAE
jgi:phosphoenolpyruvate carboxykinase (ATP)